MRRIVSTRLARSTRRPVRPLGGASEQTWTDVFSEELLRLGSTNDRVVAITAAMVYPTGLHRFAQAFPDRCFDVGIAEQHAVTSAAGLAMGGLHPVVAVYSTFLNRAFDQVADGCRTAPVRRHVRARQGRYHGTGWGQPSRHVGHVDLADRTRPAARRAARWHPLARRAGAIVDDRRRALA